MGKRAKDPKRITPGWLRKIGVPGALILGIMFSVVYGVDKIKELGPDYHENKRVFAYMGVVRTVTDGDTFRLYNGYDYRLIGINAPDRGEAGWEKGTKGLSGLSGEGTRVWLEYDRYDDDMNGRVLAWIWINCESNPKFVDENYMRLSFNRSRPGLIDNPVGCKKGKMVQEEMIKAGLAKVELYKDRGELKYQKRLLQLNK
ncbi:MAG: hypothetical protein G01um101416_922 [Microgenomates group bacterium Gr01-1014_16]|nr:MAG: hypothetical protein G01um101416_922 [Microgenomates group bacterium Gr01-1014_16]